MFTQYPELLQQEEPTESPYEIQKFCRQIEDTLKNCDFGYVKLGILAEHIFEDCSVDAFSQAKNFGFDNLDEFLRSGHMKGHIDIDDSDGITSYHFPLAKIEQQKTEEKLQNELSFLDFDSNRKVSQRNNYYQRPCQNIYKLLVIRWCKRMGKPRPDCLKPPTPQPQTAGSVRGFGRLANGIGRGISLDELMEPIRIGRNTGIGQSKAAAIRGGGSVGTTKTMGRGDIGIGPSKRGGGTFHSTG